jgi:hypothetical protein
MSNKELVALSLIVIARLGGIALAIVAANNGLWAIAGASVVLAAMTSFRIR